LCQRAVALGRGRRCRSSALRRHAQANHIVATDPLLLFWTNSLDLLELNFAVMTFRFPNPVNEKAARVVAGAVLIMVLAVLLTSWYWVLIPVAYGFWARVAAGPALSPLGWAAQNVIAPRLGAKRPVPGPPKRFAQGIGAIMSTSALVLAFTVSHQAADLVLVALALAAGLESILGYCLGCRIFGLLMRVGVVPEAVCEECADVSRHVRATVS